MHIEIQVALNFVISYLYNKLPRRRVNLFGEELEKALKDRFQGHWYPEKPFKGSGFRCLKTGDPIDMVLDRAARESGVPITDILENLPAELAVWVDPGEVSYRIGEKGAVKILYSEINERHDDSVADREVTKTFNPEAQCFQPIEAVSSSMNGLSLSPKSSPSGSSPTSAPSPTYNNNNNNNNNNKGGGGGNATTSPAPATPQAAAPAATGGTSSNGFLPRSNAPLTFTTATFAQTKFGSTKLKTSSKRANRMSPTEFSNYIKQRAMQQQLHHSHGNGHLGPIGGPSSPSRSLSPNPLAIGLPNDPYFFQNVSGMGMYPATAGGGAGAPPFNAGPRNMFDSPHFHHDNNVYSNGPNKFTSYLEPQNFYGGGPQQGSNATSPNAGVGNGGVVNATAPTPVSSPGSNQDNNKLLDGLNSFYSNPGPYQHLLVAN